MGEPLHLIIGIDVGLTCTGVAYWNSCDEKIKVINEWPEGKPATTNRMSTKHTNTAVQVKRDQNDEQTEGDNSIVTEARPDRPRLCNEHKVATATACSTSGPPLWGFPAKYAGTDVKHYFKLYLDDKAREDTGLLKNLPVEEVQKWYKDFLGGLREYLEGVWEKEWPKLWKSAKLDYIFSVPTVWLELPWIINRFKDAIKNSGFESSETCMRSWDIGLNEAAAAFCQFLRSRGGNSVSPGFNDAVIVCDAGGGTTDITAMKLDSSESKLRINQLTPVYGESIGSVQIDNDFEELVRQRLSKVDFRRGKINTGPLADAAHIMATGGFQDIKHKLGQPVAELEFYPINVPGLTLDFNDKGAGIEGGAMKFTPDEIKRLFDTQVSKMLILLDAQLESLTIEHDDKQVSALYLCGGLGSSEYVKKCIEDHYTAKNPKKSSYNTGEMTILSAKTPSEAQLAVCNGLVLGHIAQVREDWDDPESTRPLLRSSLSWGVVHNERYNKKRHEGELTRKIDGEKYAVDRNDWFIHRGDQIQPHEYSHKFSRTYTKGEPDPTLEDTVVVAKYKRDKNTSPASLWDGNVKVACNITSILPPISQEMKNVKIYKPWYKKCEKGNTTIYYEIKLIFGLSDTTAEVWFEGEKRGSAKVTWAGKSAEQDLEKHGKSVRPLNEGRIEEKRKGRWYSRFRS